ncbi:hypothetical protein HPB52_020876 [Rhipicephalus sanguineus]|uniref:Ig-like domain-containing protein n=1 Tax=Rhipicephalus sanguineus TaxID=34632 RepID=A0A9D4QFE6_RHISA|nr:hypothetical protein HPB52_020876 [Rhipicephalus sanguineus]
MIHSLNSVKCVIGRPIATYDAHVARTLCLQTGDGDAEKIYVRVGGNVTLRCPDLPPQPGQQPPRHLTWWKEDRRLIEATRERVTVAPEAGARVALVPGHSALLFRSVVAEDSGEYQCVVNNRQGRRGIVRLYVQGMNGRLT